jgi:hypothetical protein
LSSEQLYRRKTSRRNTRDTSFSGFFDSGSMVYSDCEYNDYSESEYGDLISCRGYNSEFKSELMTSARKYRIDESISELSEYSVDIDSARMSAEDSRYNKGSRCNKGSRYDM